jgi:hypothetical protein
VQKLLGELIQRGRRDVWRSLRLRDLHETTLELAIVICLADLGAEDESSTRRENHVVAVRRALDCEVAKSPYLAHQLSVFDDQQLAMGVPGAMFEGLRHMQNSTVTQRDKRFILVRALFRVIAFTSSRRVPFVLD